MMSHPFGDLLTQLRARKHGLSQARLAKAVGYDPAIVGKMCKGGKALTGPSGRNRVVRIIGALRDFGALSTLGEANALLDAAGLPPLYAGQPIEAALIQSLYPCNALAPRPDATQSAQERYLPSQFVLLIGYTGEIGLIHALLAAFSLVYDTRP